MIDDTIRYFRSQGRQVIYDAEHWFDGYKANPDYALQTLTTAVKAGAKWLVLCGHQRRHPALSGLGYRD